MGGRFATVNTKPAANSKPVNDTVCLDPSALNTTVTVFPLSNGVNQGAVSDSSMNDPVAPQAAIDSVFADGADCLSVGLTDTLI
jgi:hypothetical protein